MLDSASWEAPVLLALLSPPSLLVPSPFCLYLALTSVATPPIFNPIFAFCNSCYFSLFELSLGRAYHLSCLLPPLITALSLVWPT